MMFLLSLALVLSIPGDFRARFGTSWPFSRGITDHTWAGNGIDFYQRYRLNPQPWKFVLLTEKDPGEEWTDLVAGGVGYSPGENFSLAAGALRTQFAQGILFSNANSWGSTDPLSLSKPPTWRLFAEPAETPGVTDGNRLTGVSACGTFKSISAILVAGLSSIDPGNSGLHRSQSELESRGSVDEKLIACRAGIGAVGVSFAAVQETADSITSASERIGADITLNSPRGEMIAEMAFEGNSADFVVSAGRGHPGFRHCLTVSRSTFAFPRAIRNFGSEHNLGAGYGIRWRLGDSHLINAGISYLLRSDQNRFRTGVQFIQRAGSGLEITQRLKYSWCQADETITGRVSAVWNPGDDMTLSVKFPFSWFRASGESSETGYGVEIRLKRRPTEALECAVSATACSTEGWSSRIFTYSLSFPGEFGSKPLYDSSVFLQGLVSLHISDSAVLRAKAGWYSVTGVEELGTGHETTQGSHRTSAGLQLDYSF